jgi:subtilisin family serine protease
LLNKEIAMKRAAIIVAALLITLVQLAEQRSKAQITSVGVNRSTATSARVDPLIVNHFNLRGGLKPIPVVITYKSMPVASDLSRLQLAGITKGITFRELPMVIAPMNATQLAAVRTHPGVRSIWANRIMKPFTNESRLFIGVPQMMADRDVQLGNIQNPGMPVSGKGVGIGYIDTGIDATHADLKYGTKTVQNVIQPHSETTVGDGGLAIGIGINIFDEVYTATGFNFPIYLENQQHSDVESGHGTHGAAVAAGTGAQSGNFYGGVAPGAHLVGMNAGNELGLPLVTILGAYDYLLTNQFAYNIRIINNSWGSSLSAEGISPDDPINIVTRTAHDRNIVVVFAAGNAGDVANAINPYSTMPWTISVAAGEKRGLGTPAGFSSRGVNNGEGTDVGGMPADPAAVPNLRPDVTAPGVDIKSARMKGVGLTNTIGAIPLFVGANDLTTIPPAFLPYYTTSQGTSFACPHVAGVVALMLEARPTLTPDEVVTILRDTATPMPYEERVVGSGYVDAHNAVRRALGLSAVAHPANLFPIEDPNAPEITDVTGDAVGSDAQDIVTADFAYDAATNQLVYAIDLLSLSVTTPSMRWAVTSTFGSTDIFVTASVDEAATTYEYGRITTLATGTRNQETIGPADSGQIVGNKIIIRLSLDKINAAVGSNVFGTTTTNTQAQSQILIGTSVSGGLLLNSDSASGSNFRVQ